MRGSGKCSFNPSSSGEIRRRKPKTQRRRDGLLKYGYDNTSQSGEDGIIKRLFELLPQPTGIAQRWCVDVGAWDGKHLSNTFSLLVPTPSDCQSNWKGVLIEADPEKVLSLRNMHDPLGNTSVNVTISCSPNSPLNLVNTLKKEAPEEMPSNFDFLCIDVDGTDYWLLHNILETAIFRPKVICVEFNPTMPQDLIYIQPQDDSIRYGSSLSALVELASHYEYQLVETTCYNAFFVDDDLYQKFVRSDIPFEPSIECLQEVTMGTSLYQLYDGTLKLNGCKKLLWHRLPIKEENIQVLKKKERTFPFAPGGEGMENKTEQMKAANIEQDTLIAAQAVDMSVYCKPVSLTGQETTKENELRRRDDCANSIVDRLQRDGFALVRGTSISKEVCENALLQTRMFFHDASEQVRRSCLTKDRARRGYSPQNSENFASLIGEKCVNDLVRKFRVGPKERFGESLLQSNAWPKTEIWGEENSSQFQSSIQAYYNEINQVALFILEAIGDGLQNRKDGGSISLPQGTESISHTSILTLLGYRKGARHQGKHARPLVAAHTDVGVITVLLFDGGDSAVLQRSASKSISTGKEIWTDVTLPYSIQNDPVFVVNIGDCLSDLCDNFLPSTLHRVMPRKGLEPRNCLAHFVGFKPEEILTLPSGKSITYEEWRRLRIEKATSIFK
jgi:isopenicillin N synthase-like dioxygenase